ncbi:molecular chaperone, partial [Salmonella enterica]|nr:molecular chaperone [Salmonella enterica]
TRIIFPSNRESVSISVINSDVEDVWLLRGWVNEFESEKKTDNFIITPPLYRLDPDSKIQLRINAIDKSKLSEDIESIFYINVLAIPPEADVEKKGDDNASISFAINNRIKLFYRPESISDKRKVMDSYGKITAEQKGNKVILKNPTPYYITLEKTKVNGINIQGKSQDYMLAPYGTLSVPYSGNAKYVDYQVINDFGGKSENFHLKI